MQLSTSVTTLIQRGQYYKNILYIKVDFPSPFKKKNSFRSLIIFRAYYAFQLLPVIYQVIKCSH